MVEQNLVTGQQWEMGWEQNPNQFAVFSRKLIENTAMEVVIRYLIHPIQKKSRWRELLPMTPFEQTQCHWRYAGTTIPGTIAKVIWRTFVNGLTIQTQLEKRDAFGTI